MREFGEFLKSAQEKADKIFIKAISYAERLHQSITEQYKSGERHFDGKRAVGYPLFCAATGVAGSWATIESANLLVSTPAAAFLLLSGETVNVVDIILNNPLRQMYLPGIPIFIGGAGVAFGLLKVWAEESLGLETDYRALWDGRK